MNDVFNESTDQGNGSPEMLMGADSSGAVDYSQYRYRVERFSMGGHDTDDEGSALEALLTRSIDGTGDTVVVERKDSISATTGVYTIVVIYLEKRLNVGAPNAQTI